MKVLHDTSYGIVPLKQEEGVWKVLIVMHVKSSFWGFPKGHAEMGENPIDAASRELFEETGLKIDNLLQNDSIVESYKYFIKSGVVYKKVHYFPAIVSGNLSPQVEEIQECQFVTIDKAFELLTFKEAKAILEEVNKKFSFTRQS